MKIGIYYFHELNSSYKTLNKINETDDTYAFENRALGYSKVVDGNKVNEYWIWPDNSQQNISERDAKYNELVAQQALLNKHDKGLMADDIVLLHLSINELINHYVNWLPINEIAEKQRFKIIMETLIKYNLELINKDFDPNFIINARDRGVLITALTKVKEVYPDHWTLITPIFKLEAEATPDEVWTEYEKIMETLHTTHTTPDLTGSGIGQGI